MFERYTDAARRLLFSAEYQAALCGSTQVEPDHLLLAILQDDDSALRRLLPEEATQVARELRESLQTGEPVHRATDVRLSFSTKRALALTMHAAEVQESMHIKPEHLLLGLLENASGIGVELLKGQGVTRQSVLDRLDEPD